MTTPQQHLYEMAYAFDNGINDYDLELDSDYFIDVVMTQLLNAGLLVRCGVHMALYPAFRGECPACNWCDDCEESPCVCENDTCGYCGEDPCSCEELAS